MAKKADAWKEYREAAVVDMVLETMPKVYYYTVFFFFSTQACLCLSLIHVHLYFVVTDLHLMSMCETIIILKSVGLKVRTLGTET